MFNNRQLHNYAISLIKSDKTSALLVCVSFTNFPSMKVANVGKLETFANFLDSGNFSASTTTKVIPSFSVDIFLNLGFIIRQFPHHEAENCTATLGLFANTSCKLSCSNSNSIICFSLWLC